VINVEWCSAIEIRAGDILKLYDGSYVTVTSTEYEKLEIPVKVYNFEVEDFHTYYVGKQAALVHNTCKSFYRGGDYTARDIDVKMNKQTGLLETTRGISVNTDPLKVAKFGDLSKIETIPKGLKIIQFGKDLGHFEIVPTYPMSFIHYQGLLNQIEYTLIN